MVDKAQVSCYIVNIHVEKKTDHDKKHFDFKTINRKIDSVSMNFELKFALPCCHRTDLR
jgi:hypothetical protein